MVRTLTVTVLGSNPFGTVTFPATDREGIIFTTASGLMMLRRLIHLALRPTPTSFPGTRAKIHRSKFPSAPEKIAGEN
jgi:hypothetical protein